jgi:predicted dehydrogenase
MSETTIRWGILSTANIARARVIPAIKKSRNGEVRAVASRDLVRAQDFANANDIPLSYGSYEELIESAAVDAIYIGTPNSEHAVPAIKCAEAGKPTLCEKPLASNATEAAGMVEAFAEAGVLLAEAFMYRFHPQTDRVLEMLAEGAVGALHAIDAVFTFAVRDESNIRLSKALAGGALMDVGCYCVNAIRLLTSEEPHQLGAVARFGAESGVDESLAGIMAFPSGVVAHFDCGLRTFREHRYEIRGSAGRILVPESFVPSPDAETTIHHWDAEGHHHEITIPAADHYQLMVEDFAAALIDARPPRFAPEDAVINMAMIDTLLASAAE